MAYPGLGQVFTAFMTGNILFLGFSLADGQGLSPIGSGTTLTAFAVGAVAGSRPGAATSERRRRRLLTSAVLASALLTAAALTAIGLRPVGRQPKPRHYAVTALIALAMGLRSATTWRLGAVLNTTLVTGTLVTLIRKSALGGGTGDTAQRYRAAALVAVCVGAVIGALLLRVSMTAALLLAAAGVLAGIGGHVAHPASRS